MVSENKGKKTQKSSDDEWQRQIGLKVKTPESFEGTIINQTGGWTRPEGRGWFVVAIPGRGKRVYHITELDFPRKIANDSCGALPLRGQGQYGSQ